MYKDLIKYLFLWVIKSKHLCLQTKHLFNAMQEPFQHPIDSHQEIELLRQENARLKALLENQAGSKHLEQIKGDMEVPCAHEEAYKLFVEKAPDGVVVVNKKGFYVEVNSATVSITGYSKKELIGTHISEIILPEERKAVMQHFKAVLDSGEAVGEYRYRHKNGDIRHWSVKAVQIADNSFLVFLSDITDMKRYALQLENIIAENKKTGQALHESQTRFRLILENMPILLNAFDEKGTITVWNKACELSTGYSADEIIGNTKAMEWLYPEPGYRQEVIRMSNDPHANQNTFELTTKNGKKRIIIWFDTYHSINIPGWASWGLGLDITERRWAEKELIKAKERAEESDRLKTAFINNISHEIRTPLNSILGFGQFLVEPGYSQEERRENYEFLEESSKRLLQTITDIMDVSLITAHSIKAKQQELELVSFLNDLMIKTRKRVSEKNILVNTVIPAEDEEYLLLTDTELLTKIFDQLLSNADKFTQKGRISFGYRHISGDIEFFVTDTGKGISSDKQAMIFEAFAQEDTSVTRGYEGSGLGLTIAKGLINLLGGQIWLESDIGKGSTFYFTLPHVTKPKETTPEKVHAARTNDIQNALILIAEDDEANYQYTNAVLQMAGFTTLHAINGIEAVALIKDYPEIALVLMDIKMPLMNGLEATKRIKSHRPEMPVVALTAHAQTGDEQKMIAAGCDAYLPKPVGKQKLIDTIKRHIR